MSPDDLSRVLMALKRAELHCAHHVQGLSPEERKPWDELAQEYQACQLIVAGRDPATVRGLPGAFELGEQYLAAGDYPNARHMFLKALAVDDTNGAAWACLSQAHLYSFQDLLALECANYAVRYAPHLAASWSAKAHVHQYRGETASAIEAADRALAIEPLHMPAKYLRGVAKLLDGDFESGWPDYEARRMVLAEFMRHRFSAPFLKPGDDVRGKTVLVHSEQGIGDEIMFASCIPDLIAEGAQVWIECDPRLAPLFVRSFGVNYMGGFAAYPSLDYQIAIGSLPLRYGRTWGKFPGKPYLHADPDLVDYYRTIGGRQALKVGISWRGGTKGSNTERRSLKLDQLVPIFAVDKCKFIDLQYGDTRAEREASNAPLNWYQAAHGDFAQYAALVASCDLIITVQTALVHLAGALGVPTWVMVPAIPEWRYLKSSNSMPWYNSVLLFRQQELYRWDDEIADLAKNLESIDR